MADTILTHATQDEDGAEAMSETEQAKLLRAARDELETTNPDLAERLGVSLPTLRSWLLPTTAQAHRPMPQTARLLLAYILKDARKKERGKKKG